jgi:hypothetical protein
MISRKEYLELRLSTKLTCANLEFFKKFKDALNIKFFCPMKVGDNVNIDLSFYIEYLNRINNQIECILEVLDRKDFKATGASVEELKYGESLSYTLFVKFSQLVDKLNKEHKQ